MANKYILPLLSMREIYQHGILYRLPFSKVQYFTFSFYHKLLFHLPRSEPNSFLWPSNILSCFLKARDLSNTGFFKDFCSVKFSIWLLLSFIRYNFILSQNAWNSFCSHPIYSSPCFKTGASCIMCVQYRGGCSVLWGYSVPWGIS